MRSGITIAIIVCAAICAGGLAHAETIAILPFANASGASVPNAAGMDWIGAGIAETVREALAGHRVDVLSRNEIAEGYSFLRLRPLAELTQASIHKLGETLKADRILYGTFTYEVEAKALIIRAHVLRPQTYEQTSVQDEVGPLEQLPSLEAHLSWRVLSLMAPGDAPPEAEYTSLRVPVRLDAEESYVRGLLASTPELKEKNYRQAARLEPNYWRPAFELGKILMARKSYREAATWLEQVMLSDAGYAEAGFLLGISKFQSGDTKAAQEVLEKLAQAVPVSAIFNNLGAAQSRNGLAAAADSFRKALAGDPNDPDYHFNLAYVLWKTGDFESAADGFRAVLDRNPGDTMATLLLGRSIIKQGPHKDAAADARLLSLERIKESFTDLGYKRPKQ